MFFENYTSSFLDGFKSKNEAINDISPIHISLKNFEIFLPHSFGFCFGVRNAMKIVSNAINENKAKNKYLLSEIIHNQNVNNDLVKQGVKFIFDKNGNQIIPYDSLTKDDVCIIPAFGTTREILDVLNKKLNKENIYDTCCPFVKKVWEASKKLGQLGASVIIHGKFNHEETKATFSLAKEYAPTMVIKDKDEALFLAKAIEGKILKEDFYAKFKSVITDKFDFDNHLKKLGIVNQTTMLAQDTLEIRDIIKNALNVANKEFIDTGSTPCYATSKNQASVKELIKEKLDIVLIIGGFNSSNTTNLYKISKQTYDRTYFIKDCNSLLSNTQILSFDINKNKEIIIDNYLENVFKIGIIAGASCPDSLIEKVIKKLESF